MENDYSSFIEMDENGAVKSFDKSKMTSFIDSLVSKGVNSGVEKYKAQTAKEQEIAKMTDQEKLTQMSKDFEKQKAEWEVAMKTRERDLVVREAKSRLSKDFTENEVNLLLKNVTENEKESLKYIDDLVAERQKFINDKTKSLIEEIQSKQPKSATQSNSANVIENQKPAALSAQEIKNRYK